MDEQQRRTQAQLMAAADRIEANVTENAELKLEFGGIVLSVPDREVRLYWKGELPQIVPPAARRSRSVPFAGQQTA